MKKDFRIYKRLTWIQVCWLIAQFLLMGCGILALQHPGKRLVSVAEYLGTAMLFVGTLNVIIYYKNREEIHGAHWLLADGMSTILLSFFPLFNDMIPSYIIPLFFGVWELFSGVLKSIDGEDLREEGIKGWHWFQIIGCLELLSGIAALLKPVEDFIGMHVVVAIIFFVQSCGFLFKILIYPRLLKKNVNAI